MAEFKDEIYCLHCGENNNIKDVTVKIGHLKGMKTKTFNCVKCAGLNNYSISVGIKNPLFMAILGIKGESK